MNKALLSLLALIPFAIPSVQAAETDVLMQAMEDELGRTMHNLLLDKHDKPYFVSYRVEEPVEFFTAATFGAQVDRYYTKKRKLVVDVHVGDFKVDSTGNEFGGRHSRLDDVPIDNDYSVIRRQLWRSTDAAYKKAVQGLIAKKSHLQLSNNVDRPDDWSPETAVVSLNPPVHLKINEDAVSNEVKKLSAIFREYPRIRRSLVSMNFKSDNRYIVNSEGTRVREGEKDILFGAVASAQADDGMYVTDSEVLDKTSEDELPKYEELEHKLRAMCERLTALAEAPIVASYEGPVLFDNDAAASIFPVLSLYFCAPPDPNQAKLFKVKLGRRILPKFISIIDDPGAKDAKGEEYAGDYQIDDDGVQGQKLVIVDKGIFKTICMSRIPTRLAKTSNGHSTDGLGAPSTLILQSDEALSHDQLKAKLIALGKEDGLKTVMIVGKLAPMLNHDLFPDWLWPQTNIMRQVVLSVELPMPQPEYLYEVSVDDGKEHLVRGGLFTHVGLRLLKDIDAVGNDSQPTTISMYSWHTVVIPSLLFKEIEIDQPESETDKVPAIKAPYFDRVSAK